MEYIYMIGFADNSKDWTKQLTPTESYGASWSRIPS
ncbi:hypothetical protein AfiDRAFT_2208 [Afipia sp. 1NLS2]|nr:hypothetical protein AfiDRAFT_2208 [Afipia sp. 1NLS2]